MKEREIVKEKKVTRPREARERSARAIKSPAMNRERDRSARANTSGSSSIRYSKTPGGNDCARETSSPASYIRLLSIIPYYRVSQPAAIFLVSAIHHPGYKAPFFPLLFPFCLFVSRRRRRSLAFFFSPSFFFPPSRSCWFHALLTGAN